jgi:hypothetical protein
MNHDPFLITNAVLRSRISDDFGACGSHLGVERVCCYWICGRMLPTRSPRLPRRWPERSWLSAATAMFTASKRFVRGWIGQDGASRETSALAALRTRSSQTPPETSARSELARSLAEEQKLLMPFFVALRTDSSCLLFRQSLLLTLTNLHGSSFARGARGCFCGGMVVRRGRALGRRTGGLLLVSTSREHSHHR